MKKIEKILRAQADKDLEKYNNKDNLSLLQQKYVAKKLPVKRTHNLRVAKFAMCAACLVVIVASSIAGGFFLNNNIGSNDNNEIYYSQANIRKAISGYADLNSSLKTLSLPKLVDAEVYRFYDEPSSDTLYYQAIYNFGNDSCTFVFVTNKNYNYDFLSDEFTASNYLDYKTYYHIQKSTLVEDVIYKYNVRIALLTNAETLYLTYETIDEDKGSDNTAFVSSILDKYIILKNK